MSSRLIEELRKFWGCLSEQSLCSTPLRMTFGMGADADFSQVFGADFFADFGAREQANVKNLTSRRAAQGLALSMGGGG